MQSLSHRGATVKDAAEYFQVSTKTIRRWISAGVISAERVGPHLIRVDLDSITTTPLQYGGAA